jgi:hypothetical protein
MPAVLLLCYLVIVLAGRPTGWQEGKGDIIGILVGIR